MALIVYVRIAYCCAALTLTSMQLFGVSDPVYSSALPNSPEVCTPASPVQADILPWFPAILRRYFIQPAPVASVSMTTPMASTHHHFGETSCLGIVAAIEFVNVLLSQSSRSRIFGVLGSMLNDFHFSVLLVCELWLELLLIGCKWICCKRRVVSLALRQARACVIRRKRAHSEGDDTQMLSPALHTTPSGTRRPVPLSELRERLASGGILPARRAANRRYQKVRGVHDVLYNPTVPGDCLFACISRLIWQQKQLRITPSKLREYSSTYVAHAYYSDGVLMGSLVEDWATALRKQPTELFRGRKRWGNTLDVHILSTVFDLKVRLVNIDTKKVLWTNSSQGTVISHRRQHFTLRRGSVAKSWPHARDVCSGGSGRARQRYLAEVEAEASWMLSRSSLNSGHSLHTSAAGSRHQAVSAAARNSRVSAKVKTEVKQECESSPAQKAPVKTEDRARSAPGRRLRQGGRSAEVPGEAPPRRHGSDSTRPGVKQPSFRIPPPPKRSTNLQEEVEDMLAGVDFGSLSARASSAASDERGPIASGVSRVKRETVERAPLKRMRPPSSAEASSLSATGSAFRRSRKVEVQDEAKVCLSLQETGKAASQKITPAQRPPLQRKRAEVLRRLLDATLKELIEASGATASASLDVVQCSVIRRVDQFKGLVQFIELPGLFFNSHVCGTYADAECAVLELVIDDMNMRGGRVITALQRLVELQAASSHKACPVVTPVIGGQARTAANLLFTYCRTVFGVAGAQQRCKFTTTMADGKFVVTVSGIDHRTFTSSPALIQSTALTHAAQLALHAYKDLHLPKTSSHDTLADRSIAHMSGYRKRIQQQQAIAGSIARLRRAIEVGLGPEGGECGPPVKLVASRVVQTELQSGPAAGYEVLVDAFGVKAARKATLARWPRGSAGRWLRERHDGTFISDDLFALISGFDISAVLGDLDSWGDWKPSLEPAADTLGAVLSSEVDEPPAVAQLSASELQAVYGRGYQLLLKQGFSGAVPPPIMGVPRLPGVALQEDESQAVDHAALESLTGVPSIARASSSGAVLNPSEVVIEGGMERSLGASGNIDLLICWQLFVRQAFRLMVSISSLRAGIANYLLRPQLDIPQLLKSTGSKLTQGLCSSRTAANYIRGQLLDIRILAEIFQVAVSVLSPAGVTILSYPEDATLLLYGECELQMSDMGTEFSLVTWTRWHFMEWFESPYSSELEVAATKRVAACVAELETPMRTPVSSTAPFSSPDASCPCSSSSLSRHDGKWGDPNAIWVTTNSDAGASAAVEEILEGGMRQARPQQSGTTLDTLWPHFQLVAFDLHVTVEQLHAHKLGYMRMLQRDAQHHYGYLHDVARLAAYPFTNQREDVVEQLVELLCYSEMAKTMITVVSSTGRAVLVYPETDEERSSSLAACTLRISEDGTRFLLLSWVRWTTLMQPSAVLTTLPDHQETTYRPRADIYTIWSMFLRSTFGVAMSSQLIRYLVAEFAGSPANDVAALLLRAAAQLNRNDWSRFDAYYVRSQLFDAIVLSSVFAVAVTVENMNGHIILSYPDAPDR
eukprot:4406954-Amphidinium_carterae.1